MNDVKIEKDDKIRLIVVGDPKTGKTSFINRICGDIDNHEKIKSTDNTQINYYYYEDETNKKYLIEINELGGQDYNDILNKIIFHKIVGILFSCSKDVNDSLDHIKEWNKKCENTDERLKNIPKFIIMNKTDSGKFENDKIKEIEEEIKSKKIYGVSSKDNEIYEIINNTKINKNFEDLKKDLFDETKNYVINIEEVNEKNIDLGLKNFSNNSSFSERGKSNGKCCCK